MTSEHKELIISAINDFNFDSLRTQLKTYATPSEAMEFLNDAIFNAESDFDSKNPLAMDFTPHNLYFIPQCRKLHEKFKDRYDKEIIKNKRENANTTTPELKDSELMENTAQFKLSDVKGARINLIRVFNALYELRIIVDTRDQLPSKKDFFSVLGQMIDTDLSRYHTDLSQAMNEQKIENNLKVFHDMIEITKKNHTF